MPFRAMIKITIQKLLQNFQCEKPKVGLRRFVLQDWSYVPYNAH
jgi:hypothetical protein